MSLSGDIDSAVKRIRRAEMVVLRQKIMLRGIYRRRQPAALAEDLLWTYEEILTDYRAHLTLLLKQRGDPDS